MSLLFTPFLEPPPPIHLWSLTYFQGGGDCVHFLSRQAPWQDGLNRRQTTVRFSFDDAVEAKVGWDVQESGSSERGRCRRGQSEIPHFSK